MARYSGFILRPKYTSEKAVEDLLHSFPEIVNVSALPNTRWFSLMLSMKNPISLDDLPNNSGLFEYSIFGRWGGATFIFVAEEKYVINYLVDTYFPKKNYILVKQPIEVDGLVRKLILQPERYSITYMHAKTFAWGAALRSISFYGEDITSSGLILENVDKFNIVSCGITDSSLTKEALRVSNMGAISIVAANSATLNTVDVILKYISKNGFYLGNN